jgi:hypothetical protein
MQSTAISILENGRLQEADETLCASLDSISTIIPQC